MRSLALSLCMLAALFASAPSLAAEKNFMERGIALYNEERYDQARAVWEDGEKAGDLDCVMALGTHIHSAGRGAKHSDQKAFALYMKAAEKRHPEGMSVVGTCYIYGVGTAKNSAKGIEWLTKAANTGYSSASAELGDLYADGGFVKKNTQLAAKWHLRAAEEGHPQSQLYMGKAFMDGNGVTQDNAAAKEWLQKALAGGEDSAKALLEKLDQGKTE
jgi:TPR repeat protein